MCDIHVGVPDLKPLSVFATAAHIFAAPLWEHRVKGDPLRLGVEPQSSESILRSSGF